MGDPISLLLWIVVFALIVYIVFWALGQIPLPPPIRTVIVVVVALVFLVYLVQRFGLLAASPGGFGG
jgi:heme A synthase